MKDEKNRNLSGVRFGLEYIPLRTDPTRGLSLPGVPCECVRLEEESDTPGPLMSFVLGMGDFFRAGALFAALSLMLMIASA